ncbi:hypothetical protein MMC12_004216 [Toensbergia leucococca]|nr:hypothetical protein [Toensbergia leucococca]
MRCAALHRKLGTHISKIKSLSMDSWSNDQVDVSCLHFHPHVKIAPLLTILKIMKRTGNTASNRIYNPQNTKPPIPLDIDEVNSAMEKHLKQKYDQRLFSGGSVSSNIRHDTGSTVSSEDRPPPLPPKPARRFGFGLRASSSALPLSRSTQISPPVSPGPDGTYGLGPSSPPPIRANKQSRVFGAIVGGTPENIESKLAMLRDMGFRDDKRNVNILRGLDGDLERAIESLVRLGEGSTPASTSRSSAQSKAASTQAASQEAEYQSILSQHGQVNSQVVLQHPSQDYQNSNPSNPFQQQDHEPQPAYDLENNIHNLQISQPLFLNSTGGYPSQQQQIQEMRFQQSMTPPVPQLSQHYVYSDQYSQPLQSPTSTYNPFLPAPQQTPANAYASTPQPFGSSNPYLNHVPNNGHASQLAQGQFPQQQFGQISPQQETHGLNSQAQQYPQNDPSMYQTIPPQSSWQPQSQMLQPQQTGRIDKSSILALYNYPQSPPLATASSFNETTSAQPTSPVNTHIPRLPPGVQPLQGKRSATMPAQLSAGSRNPFLASTTLPGTSSGDPTMTNGGVSRHVSQESADVGGLQSGRHSPDVFASLSARFVR